MKRFEVWSAWEDGTEHFVGAYEREKDAVGAVLTYRAVNRHEVSKGFQRKAYWVEYLD